VTGRGKVLAVNISKEKGTRKSNVGQSCLLPEFGLKDDAHGGKWHRQVSLLAMESIAKMTQLGLKVGPGDFAENITTQGLNLVELPVGTRITIGLCVMPKEGIFARVLEGGEIKVGDEIHVLGGHSDHQ
jgi:MOSC domain-containing protein YiiM